MAIKPSLAILFIISSIVTLSSFQCSKGGINCTENFYSFNLGIRAYPDTDSIRIGDTLWLEINEPSTLKDIQSGQMIDYSGAENLGTVIGIAELLSVNTFNTEGNTLFKFLLFEGKEVPRSDNNKFKEYLFEESNARYIFKLALMPAKKGIYKIFVSNASNVFRTSNKCKKAGFSISFTNTDQHLYFNEIILPGVSLPAGGGIYLFKVY